MAAPAQGLEEIPECMLPFFWHMGRYRPVLITRLTSFQHAAQIVSNYDEITDNFDNMSLKSDLLRGLSFAPNVYP